MNQTQDPGARLLVVDLQTSRLGTASLEAVRNATERHAVDLLRGRILSPTADPEREIEANRNDGVAFMLRTGVPSLYLLSRARKLVADGRKVFFYWPDEKAIEVVDALRIASYRNHVWFMRLMVGAMRFRNAWRRIRSEGATQLLRQTAMEISRGRELKLLESQITLETTRQFARTLGGQRGGGSSRRADENTGFLDLPQANGGGQNASGLPSTTNRIAGTGLYMRLDYWGKIITGGSYGHTCFVAKALRSVTRDLECVVTNKFALLDELGVRQRILDVDYQHASTSDLVISGNRLEPLIARIVAETNPVYVYERLVLGNWAVGRACTRNRIPYILEYNGSEISMARAFGRPHEDEGLLEKIEEYAFSAATILSVVSTPIADSLVSKGVNPSRILVNPNCVDPDIYRPYAPAEKASLREELRVPPDMTLVGFCGTFGGWHGIDVLAAALPRICHADSRIRFLLIGDGNLKPMLSKAIADHGLSDRVIDAGLVPHLDGARYLSACDLLVSPHAQNIDGQVFFGSPTKLFEYMATGAAIVASDLAQLGEVMRPSLTLSDFARGAPVITVQRGVLVTPGAVDEFVEAVLALARNPEIWPLLGKNARAAVLKNYTWDIHVENIWRFMEGMTLVGYATDRYSEKSTTGPGRERKGATMSAIPIIETGDRYKYEVQSQWNQDACGSHYVRDALPNTLEWYKEAEQYRYGTYAPWMREVMEFDRHRGEKVLEIGAGLGTDLAEYATAGAICTDLDLSAGHLGHAMKNFELRGLNARFLHGDAEAQPFDDGEFDVVYTNGVIHHTPNTQAVIDEIYRVLRPCGKAIVMVYAENSWHYWARLIGEIGIVQGTLRKCSVGELMSRTIELSSHNQRPLVKVYTAARLRRMFSRFEHVKILKRQLMREEVPSALRRMPLEVLQRIMGWNLIVKADKPR